ncbi:MAG: glycosyltransferase [Hydrogenophilus thermoluteolus]
MNKKFPRVALYISVFNHEKFIIDALESAIAQDYPNLLIYVTDDASTDNSYQIIKDFFLKKNIRHDFKIIRRKRNLGVTLHGLIAVQELAKLVDFIVPQGGDDISHPKRVSTLTEIWMNLGCNKYALIHTPVEVIDTENKSRGVWLPPINQRPIDEITVATNPTSHGLVIGASAAFTPALVLDSPYIFTNLYDDQVLSFRAFLKKSLIYWGVPLLKYRFGGGVSSSIENQTQREYRIATSTLDTLKQRLIDARYFHREDLSSVICNEISRWEKSATHATLKILQEKYYEWLKARTLQESDAEVLAERYISWEKKPLITIITFASARDLSRLADSSESLQNQLYPHWRWIVVSETSSPDPLFNSVDFLKWIQIESITQPKIVTDTIFHILDNLAGDFFAFLPPGFRLSPESFMLVTDCFITNPNAAAVYCDHDYWLNNQRSIPKFKPDFDKFFFKKIDYISSTVWYRTTSFRNSVDLASLNYQASQKIINFLSISADIVHIPEPLVTIPDVEINKINKDICSPPESNFSDYKTIEITKKNNKNLPDLSSLVSIIIPIPNLYSLAEHTLSNLIQNTNYPNYELILVSHCTKDQKFKKLFQRIINLHKSTKIVYDNDEYSLARLYMVGAQEAVGDVLLFMHADVEIYYPDWLKRLVAVATDPNVAAVTPLILRNNLAIIESAGLWLGSSQLWQPARLAYANQPISEKGFYNELSSLHRVSAISSVCFCANRQAFEALGGFDYISFFVSDFEIDYCIRARLSGREVLVEPLSKIIHYDNAVLSQILNTTVAQEKHFDKIEHDHQTLFKRWGEKLSVDPYASPHFDYNKTIPEIDLTFTFSWHRHYKNRCKVFVLSNDDESYYRRVQLPIKTLINNGWVQAEIAVNTRLPSVTEIGKLLPDTILLHNRFDRDLTKRIKAWRTVISQLRIYLSIADSESILSDTLQDISKLPEYYLNGIITNSSLDAEKIANIFPPVSIYIIPDAIERKKYEYLFHERMMKLQFLDLVNQKLRIGCFLSNLEDIAFVSSLASQTKDSVQWIFLSDNKLENFHLSGEIHYFNYAESTESFSEKLAFLNLHLIAFPNFNPCSLSKVLSLIVQFGALGTPILAPNLLASDLPNSPVSFLSNNIDGWIKIVQSKSNNFSNLANESKKIHEWFLQNYAIDNIVHIWNNILVAGKNS